MTQALRRLGDPREFILFLMAGGLNTCFGYAWFALMMWIGAGSVLAVILATIAGVLFNFRTYGAVFAAEGFARLPHFILIYFLIIPANLGMLHFLGSAGSGPYLGEAVVIMVIAPISYYAMRRFVFLPAGKLSS